MDDTTNLRKENKSVERPTIIAGSRSVTDYADLLRAIDACPWRITRVVSGACRGVDQLGERWARENGVEVDRYPADWKKFGRAAGPRRNEVMVGRAKMLGYVGKTCGGLLALWDGKSRGTAGMIEIAKKRGLAVFVWEIDRSA